MPIFWERVYYFAGLEGHFFGDGDGLARDDVGHSRSIGQHLESALHRDLVGHVAAVEPHDDVLVAELAAVGADTVPGHEMTERTLGYDLVGLAAAPLKELRHIVPGFVLERGATLAGEGVDHAGPPVRGLNLVDDRLLGGHRTCSRRP